MTYVIDWQAQRESRIAHGSSPKCSALETADTCHEEKHLGFRDKGLEWNRQPEAEVVEPGGVCWSSS